VERSPGLSSLVLGETDLESVLHRLDGYPTLGVIASGHLPPNPPELFGKSSFRQLLDDARREYDWVLIDTPPVVSVTDAVVCSNLVDMVLLVVEYGRLDRKVIQGAQRQLSRAGARVVGAVLNRVDLERRHYYYESHYYSYFYGYEEDGETKAAWSEDGRKEST
jgi:capsular exopolysaccharide synthesis family protein